MDNIPVITESSGKCFLWNAKDVITLRQNHRICGVAVGSLPRKPWQNSFFSLPVLLMPVEVKFCLDKSLAKLKTKDIEEIVKEKKVDLNTNTELRSETENEQIRIFKKEKFEKSQLYYGKKKMKKDVRKWQQMCEQDVAQFRKKYPKQDDDIENKDTVKESCKDVEANTKGKGEGEEEITCEERKYFDHSIRVHIPTSLTDEHFESFNEIPSFEFPSTIREQLFYKIYQDLWSKGYYITSAEKFGGDFLVYPGDPLRYHSKFIVVVMDTKENMTSQQLMVYGRLGSSVKKTVVLGSVNEKDDVQYISVSWKNF